MRTSGVKQKRNPGIIPVLSCLLVFAATPAFAVNGPFVGVDVGASEPSNPNYRAHVQTGISGKPYAGYMFNDYLGLQGEVGITAQHPDNDQRGFPRENQWTTLLGYTAGPRLVIPFGDKVELYGVGQGGGFTGVSGRLRDETAPGFSVGGGLDYYLTDHLAVGLFGRFNRMYASPHPGSRHNPDFLVGLRADQQGPDDARWGTGGVGLHYRFNGPQVVPIPPPPPPPMAQASPPPPPPVKKKIVLRGVNFDFDKSNIRKDAAQILDEAAQTLGPEGTVGVVIVGHTDSKGSDAYNQKLSERRANSVRDYLVKHGIAASRIQTKGMGESQPVATNDTADGRAQNRRVELLVE